MIEILFFRSFRILAVSLVSIFIIELLSIIFLSSKNFIFFICFFFILALALFFNLYHHNSEAILKKKDLINIIFVFLIAISVKLFFIFRYEGIFLDIDTWSSRLVIENILKYGYYYDIANSEYFYHAGIGGNMFAMFIGQICGISPYYLVRYIIPLIITLFPVIYYLLFKRILNDYRITGIAVILFTLTSEYIWMNLRGEFLIVPLLIIAVYFLVIYIKQKKPVNLLLFFLISLVANISHSSFYCFIVIPVLATITTFYLLKKELKFMFFLTIFIYLISIPLIYRNLFPNTSTTDYLNIFKMITQLIPISFLVSYPNIYIIIVTCSFFLSFSLLSVIIHGFFSLLHKYFENLTRKLVLISLFIGLILLAIYFLSILGINIFSLLNFQYITQTYPDLQTFFFFYSFYILLFICAIIYLISSFELSIYKNWAIILTIILGLIVFITFYDVGFINSLTLDTNIPIRILFFLSFPLCILAANFFITLLKKYNKKIITGCLVFLIIFTSFFSLAKGTQDIDFLSTNQYSNENEENAMRFFCANLQDPTIIWVDYKFNTLSEALAPFEKYQLIKSKMEINILNNKSQSLVEYYLNLYGNSFNVSNSYIFLANYMNFGNLTLYLWNLSTIYYQNSEVSIFKYNIT